MINVSIRYKVYSTETAVLTYESTKNIKKLIGYSQMYGRRFKINARKL